MSSTDHIAELGLLSLGSRFKRLSDSLYQEMAYFYGSQHIDFDPGNFPLVHYLTTHDTADIGTMAKHLGISQAAVSQKAAALVKTGLIKIENSKSDRRKSHMRLTEKGRKLVALIEPSWNIIRNVIDKLLGEDAMPLLNTLQKIEDGVASGKLRNDLQQATNRVTIVPYSKKRSPLFDRLNRAWIHEYFTVEPFDDQVLTNPKKMIIDNGGEVWFAALDGEVVGTCALIMLKNDMFEFSKLGVDETARGKGVARALLRHCIARAQQHGHKKLRIFTSTKLAPANALYRSEGFVEVEMSAAEKSRYCRCDIMYDLKLG